MYSYFCLFPCVLQLGLWPTGHAQYRWDPDAGRDNRQWQTPGYNNPRQYGPVIDRHRWPNNLDIGDTRCQSAITQNTELRAIAELPGNAVVEGRYIYLCDGPGVPEHNRPSPDRAISEFYRNVSVFLGIPYAEPPTTANNNRFRPPKVKKPWGVVNATYYRPACPQAVRYYGLNMGVERIDEDCLYLNIFTPTAQKGIHTKFAVMVYIHGGNWDHGNVNTFPAHMLAASQEVVVVTLNYRLGALGFLATGDKESAGNYGLLDQAMAIQWVYEHIRYFNGEQSNIVLFGPGAGAASAGMHALAPKSADFITRVIAQSGSALADWAVITDPTFAYNSSRIFGQAIGCTMESSYYLVECLRSRTISEIISIDRKPKVGWLLWGPVLDNYTRDETDPDRFFPRSPEDLIKETNFPTHFQYMAGVTRDEAVTMMLDDQELQRTNFIITWQTLSQKVKEYMQMYNFTLNSEAIYNAITFMYADRSNLGNTTLLRQGYIDMLSDSYFKAPNDKIVKQLVAKGVDVYMYVLNYTIEGTREPQWYGARHDSEYFLITGAPFMDVKFYPKNLNLNRARWTEADRNMSTLFMQAWANFAKYGKPTPQSLFNTILWEPMRTNNLQYLSINTTNLTSVMLQNYRQKECQFWNEYLPTLIDQIPPTWPPMYETQEQKERRVYASALWGVVAAAALFLILTLLFCCLFCRAKSKHLVEDEDIPDAISTSDSFSGMIVHAPTQRTRLQTEVIENSSAVRKDTRV